MERIVPDWGAPAGVRAFVTTRGMGDMREGGEGRVSLQKLVPGEPLWLKQVHGVEVSDVEARKAQGDAWVCRVPGKVCGILVADCMPVLLASEDGKTVGIAHAGWRGLAAGVIGATLAAMKVDRSQVLAWLGPAIGPKAYEVGEDVRAALGGYEAAFIPARPRHWMLDLYAVARRQLEGVKGIFGGGACTYSERDRYFSYRRDQARERMAALIWIESRSP